MALTGESSATAPPTEQRLPNSIALDLVPTLELLEMINREDAKVADAVRSALPMLADIVDRAEAAVRSGATIHYFGAGTSGRFGVLDAAEVPPTYGVPSDRFVAHLAGGSTAMTSAVENAEDNADAGHHEAAETVRPGDIVFGLAASGRTPYVHGAITAARSVGALTVAVTSNPRAPLADASDYHLYLPTGPEVVTGSTRMKAGTAQKMLLHTFSTALMVRLGRTYSNLMIDVVATNDKLRARVATILQELSGESAEEAGRALEIAGGDAKVAAVMLLAEVAADEARVLLSRTRGVPRRAVDMGRAARQSGQAVISTRKLCIGIDVGASGYRLTVAGDDSKAVQRGLRPHVDSRGLQLDAILERLGDDLRLVAGDNPISCVGVGIAGGAYLFEDAGLVAATVAGLCGADSAIIMPDSVAAYVGAVGVSAGVVLAAGTGAVAIATDLEHQFRRTDGLGHLLGDYGSGARLGQLGLEIATRTEAGRDCPSPALRSAMLRRFGGTSELVRSLYTSEERSAVLASFVPDIVEAAESGDPCSRELIRRVADELAQTLIAAGEGIEGVWAVTGGLVAPASLIRGQLDAILEAKGHQLTPARSTPAQGAATLAQAFTTDQLPPILDAQLSAAIAAS